MDRMRSKGQGPSLMLKMLRKKRAGRCLPGPSLSSVKKYVAGHTHQRGVAEKRGRKKVLTSRCLQEYNKVRLQLQKTAQNEHVVTWSDIAKAGSRTARKKGLLPLRTKAPSTLTLSRRMRAELKVTKRPARARIARTTGEEKQRYEKALEWSAYSASWWSNSIHAFIDNKSFVLPLTSEQKKRQRQAKVTYHLRKPCEGCQPEYYVPKTKRMLDNFKTVEITAAVNRKGIFFWHETTGRWNGQAAVDMYSQLRVALQKECPNTKRFRIVEDGDRKGFQSGAGIESKTKNKLESWKLPPRTPQWQPLDFCLWTDIDKRMLAGKTGPESKIAFLKRLRRVALATDAELVKRCLDSIKSRVDDTVQSKGKHTYRD